MKRILPLVFVAAVALYLPSINYGFVQDDRAIIVTNPAAHSIGAALRAFRDPYWPRESGAGLYRPVTILSYALDWSVSGGRAGWFHFINAIWHGVVTVLLVTILARWLSPIAAAAAGLVFAWHPVHVEAVASLVGRAELLAAAGILGAVLAARRGWWVAAVGLAALAMFSKEHGVIVGVVILIDRWLQGPAGPSRYPLGFWIALAGVTVGFLAAWLAIGWVGASDAAAVFYGTGVGGRLAVALPAILRAAVLLIWPASLSIDYNPQVLPAQDGISAAAVLGAIVAIGIPALAIWSRRRHRALSFTASLAGLSYLPTANLLFPSGVVLAERNLYLAVALPAGLVATVLFWLDARATRRAAVAAVSIIAAASVWRSIDRLPSWRDNRSQLVTLLAEHPESYRAHASAAAVLAGMSDTAGARREYRMADSLFSGDPYVAAARAMYLLGIGDTSGAVPLVARARAGGAERMALRAEFLLALARRDRARAVALVDSAGRQYPSDRSWYAKYLQ